MDTYNERSKYHSLVKEEFLIYILANEFSVKNHDYITFVYIRNVLIFSYCIKLSSDEIMIKIYHGEFLREEFIPLTSDIDIFRENVKYILGKVENMVRCRMEDGDGFF